MGTDERGSFSALAVKLSEVDVGRCFWLLNVENSSNHWKIGRENFQRLEERWPDHSFVLVDLRHPTGYSQVMEELSDATGVMEVDRTYSYGLDLIAQDRFDVGSSAWDATFYLYDGHGNVRALADDAGIITDTYDYDAFGTLIEQLVLDVSASGLVPVTTDNRDLTTDNNYLYCGEQFDPDLGLYFLRARYMDTDRGRFWSMDTWEGWRNEPMSLHKYLYANANPIRFVDPTGHGSLTVGKLVALSIRTWFKAAIINASVNYVLLGERSIKKIFISAAVAGTSAVVAGPILTIIGGLDFLSGFGIFIVKVGASGALSYAAAITESWITDGTIDTGRAKISFLAAAFVTATGLYVGAINTTDIDDIEKIVNVTAGAGGQIAGYTGGQILAAVRELASKEAFR